MPGWPGDVRTVLRDVARGASFLAQLGAHLRAPVAPDRARQVVRQRLEAREADFLRVVRRGVFEHPASPYHRLLRGAGIAFEDLARLVREGGLEAALSRLFAEGVFLTTPELKGLQPVVRGSTTFSVTLERLRHPAWSAPHPVSARPVGLYRAMLADLAVNATLALEARGGTGWRLGQWFRLPDVSAVVWLLRHQGVGYVPDRWFTRIDPRTSPDRLAARLPTAVRLVSTLAGCPLPRAQYVPLDDPGPVVDWMRDALRSGRTPHLATSTSAAVHLCETARHLGADLEGAQFRVSSDPATEDRMAAIRRAGARAVPSYGAAESGQMSYGCLAPVHADDMHFYDDVHAVIQPGAAAARPELPAGALLISSLRASTPYVLLNVSLGDQGVLEARSCGCPFDAIGWRTHLHGVRSFEKMKVGGATLLVGKLVTLLEATLPGRFGGGPVDFQLVEGDGVIVDGMPRLRLVIHPRVGPLDEDAVREAFLTGAREAGLPLDLRRQTRWLVVERRPPYESAHGKIYHVHRSTAGPVGRSGEPGYREARTGS